LTRDTRATSRVLQLDFHPVAVRFLHRYQGDQLQITQLQRPFAEGNLAHRTAKNHEQFEGADLDGVIDEPDPRLTFVQWPREGVITDA